MSDKPTLADVCEQMPTLKCYVTIVPALVEISLIDGKNKWKDDALPLQTE